MFLSIFFFTVISAAGTVLDTGNLTVLAQDIISATTPIIAKILIVFILFRYNCVTPTCLAFRILPCLFEWSLVSTFHLSVSVCMSKPTMAVLLSVSYRYVVFFNLPITVACMKRLAFRSCFLSSYNHIWYELKRSINHWLPNVLYTLLWAGFPYLFNCINNHFSPYINKNW